MAKYDENSPNSNSEIEIQNREIIVTENFIEKMMLQLDPSQTKEQHAIYLAGVIDTLMEIAAISASTRDTLYPIYCF